MKGLTTVIVLLVLSSMVSGCFSKESNEMGGIDSFFDEICPDGFANNSWYHFPNSTDIFSMDESFDLNSILIGENIPICAKGTYYGIGVSTFEPTIGITSQDNLFMTSWGNGPGGSTAIIRCSNMIEMTSLDYVCENTYQGQIVNSNDPYVYVDPWTDRIMKFDMHALVGMTVEWSDDEGETWGPLGLLHSQPDIRYKIIKRLHRHPIMHFYMKQHGFFV